MFQFQVIKVINTSMFQVPKFRQVLNKKSILNNNYKLAHYQ